MTTSEPQVAGDGETTGAGGGADLHLVVAAQAELIDQLQHRLERLEGERGVPAAAATTPVAPTATATSASGLDTPTSRRNLMTKGAAAAASAVIGTAAVGLATATPAAADSGTFDGDPAVDATANPDFGTAIQATVGNGTAVRANATGTDDFAIGVYATSNSPEGWGIYTDNLATTGFPRAIQAWASGPDGVAIDGSNNATGGAAIGVQGYNTSPDGRAIFGWAAATTGATVAVQGRSDSPVGHGVEGIGNAATGANRGVSGTSSSDEGTGVYGGALRSGGSTFGVVGETDSAAGTAIRAIAGSNGTGIASLSNRTQLRFDGAPAAPPGAAFARLKGEMVFDTNADLWLCVAAGTPGTWRKLAGPATAGAFTILPSTIRIYDSRPGTQPPGVTKTPLGNLAERTIDAKIGGAVPAGATAVLVNLTIVNTTGSGYLGLFKNGIPYPGNSTINWNQPNTLLANSAVVALDDQARFSVKANVGFCDFVIDAIGYYR